MLFVCLLWREAIDILIIIFIIFYGDRIAEIEPPHVTRIEEDSAFEVAEEGSQGLPVCASISQPRWMPVKSLW